MSGSSRPPIPESVKRQVRRECYFGCVVCGAPIYQIDHITDYATVKEHEADNLALLCGLHHDEKTRGRVSAQAIRRARHTPYNRHQPMTGTSRFAPTIGDLTVWLGNTAFDATNGQMDVVVIDGHALLSVSNTDGVPLVSANIMDDANHTMFELICNEWRASTSNFDVVTKGARTTIYDTGEPQPLLDFTFDVNTPRVTFHNATIHMNGIEIVVSDDGPATLINTAAPLNRTRISGFPVALAVGQYARNLHTAMCLDGGHQNRIRGPWEHNPVPPQAPWPTF